MNVEMQLYTTKIPHKQVQETPIGLAKLYLYYRLDIDIDIE